MGNGKERKDTGRVETKDRRPGEFVRCLLSLQCIAATLLKGVEKGLAPVGGRRVTEGKSRRLNRSRFVGSMPPQP